MKESIVTAPLFNPDSEDEDDVEMNDNESDSIISVPQGNATAGEVVLFRHLDDFVLAREQCLLGWELFIEELIRFPKPKWWWSMELRGYQQGCCKVEWLSH